MHNSHYNRNLMGKVKRPNKGFSKYGKYTLLADRLHAELEAYVQYQERVFKPKK